MDEQNPISEGAIHAETINKRFSKTTIVIGAGVVLLIMVVAVVHYVITRPKIEVGVVTDTALGKIVTEPQSTGTSTPPIEIISSGGKEYPSGQLTLRFKPEVPVSRAKEIIEAKGATVMKNFVDRPIFLISIKEGGKAGVENAIKIFSGLPEVESAEPNYFTTINAQ